MDLDIYYTSKGEREGGRQSTSFLLFSGHGVCSCLVAVVFGNGFSSLCGAVTGGWGRGGVKRVAFFPCIKLKEKRFP
jgi:hypothetical protein